MIENSLMWFREAKYGMFIHWGLYALLGGVYKGEKIPYVSEWIMKNAQIPLKEYAGLMNSFQPVSFDAMEWVLAAKKCGMKYLVFTAKHHDGFAMYDSKVSDYTVMHTPFGRDILLELADACHQEGLHLGIYYSQMQDWQDKNADGNTWDYPDPEKKEFRKYFEEKVKPQVKELMTQYGKVDLIWFDTPYDMPKELCAQLKDWVKKWQPDCLVNGRIGYGLGDYREMGDNHIPVLSYPGAWETPMTLNDTWGYAEGDENWKSPKRLMEMMVNIVGRGGNFLLNVGPDGLGSIPKGSLFILEELGMWLSKNGESIYNTTPTPDFPYQFEFGGMTYRDRILYMHVINYPQKAPYEITLLSIETKAKRVTLLETGEELEYFESYEIARDEFRLRIRLPKEPVNALNTVVRIELESFPKIRKLENLDRMQQSGGVQWSKAEDSNCSTAESESAKAEKGGNDEN